MPGWPIAKCFFQRNWTSTLPKAIDKVDVSDAKKKEWHVGVNDLAGVISLVQIGVLEIHTWNCRGDNVEHPDQLVFDLDPGPDVPWKKVIEATRTLHDMLNTEAASISQNLRRERDAYHDPDRADDRLGCRQAILRDDRSHAGPIFGDVRRQHA